MQGKSDSNEPSELSLSELIREADANYKPFPSFADWAKTRFDQEAWLRGHDILKRHSGVSPDLLRRARNVVKRVAAIETGAIEALYDTDRGFTFTVATQAAMWEATLDARDAQARSLIKSQLLAYDHVLDLTTQAVPIAEAWIRELHKTICQGQTQYIAQTEMGAETHDLPLGEYKHLPNHVRTAAGSIHSYAPVEQTPAEMHRLCEELRTEAFRKAHVVLQASYAHYGLVAVHPFADGNGRVARALASVSSYREESVPFLVLSESRKEYFGALAAADAGVFEAFVQFTLQRLLAAIRLVDESIVAASVPQPEEMLEALQNLYITRGGFTHAEVDRAGNNLLGLFAAEVSLLTQENRSREEASFISRMEIGTYAVEDNAYRLTISPRPQLLEVVVGSVPPAAAQVRRQFGLEVPRDCGRDDNLRVRILPGKDVFEAGVREVLPHPTGDLQLRIRMRVRQVFGQLLEELHKQAKVKFHKQGY